MTILYLTRCNIIYQYHQYYIASTPRTISIHQQTIIIRVSKRDVVYIHAYVFTIVFFRVRFSIIVKNMHYENSAPYKYIRCLVFIVIVLVLKVNSHIHKYMSNFHSFLSLYIYIYVYCIHNSVPFVIYSVNNIYYCENIEVTEFKKGKSSARGSVSHGFLSVKDRWPRSLSFHAYTYIYSHIARIVVILLF